MFEAELLSGELEAVQAGDRAPLRRILSELNATPAEVASAEDIFAATASAPQLGVSLRLRRNGREQVVGGGVGPGLVVTLAEAAPGAPPPHLVLGMLDELARLVAELVDLGPRPYDPERPDIPMPYEPLDAFAGVGCDRDTLQAMHAAFAADYAASDLDALFDGTALRWTLTLWADEVADDPQTRLDVIDARDRGLWLIDAGPEPESVWVRPLTSSALWVLLTGMADAAAPVFPG